MSNYFAERCFQTQSDAMKITKIDKHTEICDAFLKKETEGENGMERLFIT